MSTSGMSMSGDPFAILEPGDQSERVQMNSQSLGDSLPPWRDSLATRQRYRDRDEPPAALEGAAHRRAQARHSAISPWLFVMATALNTMVAAVLSVIITLGVVRQERTDGQAREGASAAGYTRSASG